MTWYSKPLGDGIWADVPSEEIKRLFQPLFEAAGRPAKMAVFTRHEEGSLHCMWVAYFSPVALEVAKAVESVPCERPVREGLSLLAGSDECWAMLFNT
jgi:hypothetical protein